MAVRDEPFRMPDGSTYILRRPAADSAGAFVEMDFILPSGCVAPPPHVHPHQVEDYQVLEGSLEVVIDGRWQTLAPGQSAAVPLGALHTFRNRSGQTATVRNRHTPAMRFEQFIEQTSKTLRAAGITRQRDPRVAVYLSMVMLEFKDTLAPGRARERIPMKALAAIARMLPAAR
jgi:mannose-6-phosphate isomerase-like protein (cupin superfamily)